MKLRSLRVLVLCVLGVFGSGSVHGALRSVDDLFHAVDSAGGELAADKDRGEVLERLRGAIQKHPDSEYRALAEQLATDLEISMKGKPTMLPGVATPMMDTKVPFSLLFRVNQRTWQAVLELHASDPSAHLLRADQSIIEAMIPALSDVSPTRSHKGELIAGDLPRVWRVCDYALRAIELHSRCRFHFNASSGNWFHNLSAEDRAKIRTRISEWWEKNRNASIADGIRDQLPHGDYYAKIEMAEELFRLEEGNREANREDAIKVLKPLVEVNGGYSGVSAAEALARMGDLSPMKIYYQRCLDALERQGLIMASDMVFYMTEHGSRREWEVLTRLAQREIEQGKDAGSGGVWPALVNNTKAEASPYAIPGLALALTQTKLTSSYADMAVLLLQKLTGKDFGYQLAGSGAERSAAIAKARDWWEKDGKKEYTFDRLEKMAGGE